jgi:hypothetical protein
VHLCGELSVELCWNIHKCKIFFTAKLSPHQMHFLSVEHFMCSRVDFRCLLMWRV